MAHGPVVHWLNNGVAGCGASMEPFASRIPIRVTCPKCIIVLEVDALQRRLAAHSRSVVIGSDRGFRGA
jgi:hypothetical protein